MIINIFYSRYLYYCFFFLLFFFSNNAVLYYRTTFSCELRSHIIVSCVLNIKFQINIFLGFQFLQIHLLYNSSPSSRFHNGFRESHVLLSITMSRAPWPFSIGQFLQRFRFAFNRYTRVIRYCAINLYSHFNSLTPVVFVLTHTTYYYYYFLFV